jgi:hypothetical protein
MKTVFTCLLLSIFSLPVLTAQNTVESDATPTWIGFMTVFNLAGGFEFGSAWGFADIKSSEDMAANTLILQPNFNTYANALNGSASDRAYWINPATMKGNKTMLASTFVEPGASFNGVDLTFQGAIQSYTLDTAYSVEYFIKALDPNADFSDALGGAYAFDLPTSGTFSVTVPAAELAAGLLVQYGFTLTGLNGNPADEAALGNVTLGAFTTSVTPLNNLQAAVSVYPNPTNAILSIRTDVQVQSFVISSLLGQTVLTGNATTEVDVSRLAKGTYFITIYAEEGSKVMKFIKN